MKKADGHSSTGRKSADTKHSPIPAAKKICVITPYLHHDGSSLLLYRFLKWARSNRPECRFDILYLSDGPVRHMLEKLENVDEVVHLKPKLHRYIHRFESRFHKKNIQRIISKSDAVYCNTIVSLKWLESFLDPVAIKKNLLPPITVHVRELGYWLVKSGVTQRTFDFLPVRAIADSSLTAKGLTSRFTINNCSIIDEYCDTEEVRKWKGADQIRAELGVAKSRKIVGMSGTVEWRKGPDIFIWVARQLAELMEEPPLFVWVGGFPDPLSEYQVNSEIKRLGMESMVVFMGSRENPYPYYASMDVFMLTSREEPFGAVCLEAAALGIPSLCQKGCAGAESFIGKDVGIVVESSALDSLSLSLKSLLENDERRFSLGRKAEQECMNSHALDVLLPRLMDEILKISNLV
jgi:glycosyltransferase involved in cell wall biosynthesis